MEQTGVIIVAGGVGSRMQSSKPKQFAFLDGRPILAHTIDSIAKALPHAEIIVVLPEQHIEYWNNLKARFDTAKHRIVAGGDERFHSVSNGLTALNNEAKYIAIHDGVRPFVSRELVEDLMDAARAYGAAIPVIRPVDSLRVIDNKGGSQIIDRNTIRIVQTPQIFEASTIREAYSTPFSPHFTDDASVVESFGKNIYLCDGERDNIKITTPEDIQIAEAILNSRSDQTEM